MGARDNRRADGVRERVTSCMRELDEKQGQARTAFPADRSVAMELAMLYNRTGQFEQTVETLEQAASLATSDPKAQHLIATFYEEKVRRDSSLSPGDRLRYIQAGIAAEDRALQLSPDYVDAMIVKNILWRHQATGGQGVEGPALVLGQGQLRRRPEQHRDHAVVTGLPTHQAGVAVDSRRHVPEGSRDHRQSSEDVAIRRSRGAATAGRPARVLARWAGRLPACRAVVPTACRRAVLASST